MACRNEFSSASPFPAMSKAVPWSGDVRMMGSPAVKFTPSSIESYDSAMELGGSGLTPDAHMRALEAVTREDVVNCAKRLLLHSTYFLEGGSSHEAD